MRIWVAVLCLSIFGKASARTEEKYRLTGENEAYFSQHVEKIRKFSNESFSYTGNFLKRGGGKSSQNSVLFPDEIGEIQERIQKGFDLLLNRHDALLASLWSGSSALNEKEKIADYLLSYVLTGQGPEFWRKNIERYEKGKRESQYCGRRIFDDQLSKNYTYHLLDSVFIAGNLVSAQKNFECFLGNKKAAERVVKFCKTHGKRAREVSRQIFFQIHLFWKVMLEKISHL